MLGLPCFWLYNPDEDVAVRKEDRGGLPFDENGSGTNDLVHQTIIKHTFNNNGCQLC